ncbi:MAG: glucose-1-phosphate adenylyltransferase [Halanaerobiaceae bacterium]
MSNKEVIAMLLAGGQGTRLRELTEEIAKPAVHFGGKYRIIDFALSNCTNSGINTIGVLIQYEPFVLNSYIGSGRPWDLDRNNGGLFVLPPYIDSRGDSNWYKGTADAVYHNISFIEEFNPEHVLILSGDHIYQMDYRKMLDFHRQKDAEVTISVRPVPWEEASRFGLMNTDDEDRIMEFQEKPDEPESNLASMGVYLFKWEVLREYLLRDDEDKPAIDFGGDIMPRMLKDDRKVFAYCFNGYWKDVGTVKSFWEANMDLLEQDPDIKLDDPDWHIFSRNPNMPVQYISPTARLKNSMANEGCIIHGDVEGTLLYYGVKVGAGSVIRDSVILPDVKIGENVKIERAIIGEKTIICDNAEIGIDDPGITLVGNRRTLKNGKEVG